MKKFRVTEKTVNEKIVYVIQRKVRILFFSFWVDLDDEMRLTRKKTCYYEQRIEAKNMIKFS